MITKGMPEAWATGPQVESVPYPAVMVTRAVTDGSALDVVLRPTNGGGRHPVELSQLRRAGAEYGVIGGTAATLVAAARGRATVDVDLGGRHELRVVPVA
jgi:hypothetical protein